MIMPDIRINRISVSVAGLGVLTLMLFLCDIGSGAVAIPVGEVWKAMTGGACDESVRAIILDIRLVKALVALMAGAALSVSGLQMQTLFRNPLAGPYVLGISSGASLGVALFVLGAPLVGLAGRWMWLGSAGAAWLGSVTVLVLVSVISARLKDIMVVLILGMMFSSGIGAIVQILQFLSREDALKSYVLWTMGSLSTVTSAQLAILVPAIAAGLVLALLTVKPLNMLLFGEEYALTMGLNLRSARGLLFTSTTLLAGTVTAFCGPIGFIGLAMPHVARMITDTADHRVLVPASMFCGAASVLLCDILASSFTLPVNAVTALLGIPVVIYVLFKAAKG
ncbi:MAG TPA: iron ABC transporter [Porphyromonadaceae bacterium]|jgi:ABC-type Fe3+-siderophore transport system, permease component|nr:iron ABC transporter permease [Muribaculaceae bacterium Isolate-013 (NCI)]HAB41910.1 iron ABC transporter [Porphyromonadaceae bacterium]HAP28604.1 iron ABC transporter [Porphyromonadaceae bacterium]